MWVAFFSKNISVYAIFNDQSFNNMLTNDIVSFKQLGYGFYISCKSHEIPSLILTAADNFLKLILG